MVTGNETRLECVVLSGLNPSQKKVRLSKNGINLLVLVASPVLRAKALQYTATNRV